MEWFGASVLLMLGCAMAALVLGARPAANAVGAAGAVLGCLAGLVGLFSGPFDAAVGWVLPWGLPLGGAVLDCDPVSRIFLLPVFILGATCAVSGAANLGGEHAAKTPISAPTGFSITSC